MIYPWNKRGYSKAGWWFLATPLKNRSSSIGMMKFPRCGKMKNVPNHQPASISTILADLWLIFVPLKFPFVEDICSLRINIPLNHSWVNILIFPISPLIVVSSPTQTANICQCPLQMIRGHWRHHRHQATQSCSSLRSRHGNVQRQPAGGFDAVTFSWLNRLMIFTGCLNAMDR